ncbi:Transporter, Major facilitator superfamily [Roseibacterium elongatum DSM 19469]|uniref:Transporter, Major facilitator superfamily n=1 Tax=Roseicyclus elongatus DSM 19469 TaxID=1294273 RepID=W8RUM5_9RHOB|nr:MFS transporter [Roseibacterium elongatum]AHM04918.1 Transporter, Major facilitator superfamily [Roseibacterium elongatum DSM 19469]
MLNVIRASWALLLGMFLLQIGNGLQGSLMGVRGALEGFTTVQLSLIGSAYFVGFLGGSTLAPKFIARVGHVRVFAALASLISAVMISYPVVTDPYVWMALRVIVGFSLSGVYVTAESWLNNSSTNETRGKSLSAYMLMQMFGLVAGQAILSAGDPSGWILFVIPSILVSLSFAPILLSATPTPAFDAARPMTLRQLYAASPFGVIGMTAMGCIFAGQFAMAPVYATEIELSLLELSGFVSSFFIGAIVLQYPIGWLSDRMDRRVLIIGASFAGAAVALIGALVGSSYTILLVLGLLNGGLAQPLYALIIAYTNDYLDPEDMAAASGGLMFVNGIGAILGPLAMGVLMSQFGPAGFWMFLAAILVMIAVYGVWRMTQRVSAYAEEDEYEAVSYASILPGAASPVAVETAQELYVEAAEELAEAAEEEAAMAENRPENAS